MVLDGSYANVLPQRRTYKELGPDPSERIQHSREPANRGSTTSAGRPESMTGDPLLLAKIRRFDLLGGEPEE